MAFSPPPVAYLVHGTWPRGLLAHFFPGLSRGDSPLWYEPGSSFRARLEDQGITCRPFEWSGSNSIRARVEAGKELRRVLMTEQQATPNARHFVIAHSHGGNVALCALAVNWEANRESATVDGLATLATPFIHVRRRIAEEGNIEPLLLTAELFGVMTLFFAAYWAIFPGSLPADWDSLSKMTKFLRYLTLVPFVASMYTARYVWVNVRNRVLLAPTPDVATLRNLLVLRAARDEASLVLAVSQLIGFASERACRLVVAVLERCVTFALSDSQNLLRPIPLLLMVITFGVSMTAMILLTAGAVEGSFAKVIEEHWNYAVKDGRSPAFVLASHASMIIILFFGLPGVFLCLTLGILVVLAGLGLAPFSWELVFSGLDLEVNAEATPPGRSYSVEIVHLDPKELRRAGLRHSLHDFESVRSKLLEWMKDGSRSAETRSGTATSVMSNK